MTCEPWPLDDTCIPGEWPQDPTVVERLRCIASDMLWAASGRTVGVCRYSIRPCDSDEGDLCQGVCGCAPVCSIRIGQGQVTAVERILIDGEAVPEDAWRLYAGGTLVLARGWCFPRCQDLSLPASEPGTWEITYLEGQEPSGLAARAMTAMVAELARECAAGCGVPTRRLASWTVEGASFNTDMEGGDLGEFASIPQVDDWLAVVNPYRARRQAAVFAPGRREFRPVTRGVLR